MKRISPLALALLTALGLGLTTGFSADLIAKGNLVEKQKSINGSGSIEQNGEVRCIVLADNFKAKNGPELKIFLSPTPLLTVTDKTAIQGSILIAELKSV